eukprot:9817091-Lingulodinium_polyedra.AAC.1
MVLLDANGRVGSAPTLRVGDLDAEPQDLSGERLVELCDRFQLMAPQTLREFKCQGQARTWTSKK